MAIIAGIAGGSGAGKTTVAAAVAARFSPQALVIECDWYYRAQDALPPAQRAATNYDHPGAIELELLLEHVRRLAAGVSVDAPVYDFSTHTRRPESRRLTPHTMILVEGIHALHYPELRALYAWSVYVDAPADIRFIRRLRRDMAERGRSAESVAEQYLGQVRPMHEQFAAPARAHATLVVSGEDTDASAARVIALAAQHWPA